ncbi:two-component system sensor histidine kinase NtrB [Desulfonatronovibrio hydrogenovorans]|uniref:two-component system sensor histidine kinase NtrB n=1 Tax=Desulfonatronovibrio hydrogenovorans TaxID=53245 RepID=UPI00048DDF16|nr:ATP-binding protein [Desulfonatronovibrio hydrogenovorans]
MDIGISRKYAGTMVFLAVGLLILGLALILLTWQNLRQQQDHVREQLEVTGRAIIRSVEANLYRSFFRGMGPRRWAENGDFTDLARDILEELVADGDVVFLDMSGPMGRLFISRDGADPELFRPSPQMMEQARSGTWTGITRFMDKEVFIMGIPTRRSEFLIRGRHVPGGDPELDQGGVVFIALDMAGHLELYSGYKRTIIFQTLFTLGAVLVFWFLLLAYLRKKDQDRKLVSLKTFHSRLLDNMPDGLLSMDQAGIITAANPAAREILGSGAEMVGEKLSTVMAPGLEINPGIGWIQADLDDKSLEILVLPIKEEQQSLVLLRDRTRMKELEKDLERSRDLATLGRFAAGLAHEIRNPLSSLKGFAQYFLQKFKKDDPAHSYAQTMVRESDRLNRVVSDLLYLARPRPVDPSMLHTAEVFEEVGGLLRSDLAAKGCRLETRPEAPMVFADRDLLKQALINLVLNSLSALDGQAGLITLKARQSGNMVEISVSDNGPGMDAETRNRAMEPFFSTRTNGTGLGLAIVERIVRDHGGSIRIDSSPGLGARVSLYFRERQE